MSNQRLCKKERKKEKTKVRGLETHWGGVHKGRKEDPGGKNFGRVNAHTPEQLPTWFLGQALLALITEVKQMSGPGGCTCLMGRGRVSSCYSDMTTLEEM